ncbi:hypothetical protein, partial [Mangrovibrevibacter kandeliae]|uniref:hypothetical protein n=1 Tax=Mangrovibrevibacter kandeliae TaxID=2968473 RepID=UPI002118985D
TAAADARLSAGSNLKTRTVTAGTLAADAGGDLGFGTVQAASLMADAGGALGFDTIATTGPATLTAGGALTGTRLSAGSAALTAASMDLGTATVAEALTATSVVGEARFASLTAGSAGLTSAGALTVTAGDIGGALVASSAGDGRFDTLSAGSVTASSGAGLTLGSVTTSGDQDWTSAGDLGFGKLETTGTGGITVASTGGHVTGGTLTSAGVVRIGAAAAIDLDRVEAVGAVTAAAGGRLRAAALTSGETMNLTAGAGVAVGAVQARSLAATGAAIDIDRAVVDDRAAFLGDEIRVGTTRFLNPSTQRLTVTGRTGAPARQVTMRIDATRPQIDRLSLVTGSLGFSSDRFAIGSAYVVETLSMMTPTRTLLVDNLSAVPRPRGVDVQLYAPNQSIGIVHDGAVTTSSARRVDRQPGSPLDIMVSNVLSQGVAVVRGIGRSLSRSFGRSGGLGSSIIVGGGGAPGQSGTAPTGGTNLSAAVNLTDGAAETN